MHGASLIPGVVVAPAWCMESLAPLILALLTCHRKHPQWPVLSAASPARRPGSPAARGRCEPRTCPEFSAWSAGRAGKKVKEEPVFGRGMLAQGGCAAARCLQVWERQVGNAASPKGTWSPDLGLVSSDVPRRLTVRNLKPSGGIRPARNPAARAPKGVTSISPAIPITAAPAKVPSWI